MKAAMSWLATRTAMAAAAQPSDHQDDEHQDVLYDGRYTSGDQKRNAEI